MISVAQAKKLIKSNLPPRQTRVLEIGSCTGVVLATDVKSGVDVPNFDNSAMDGYAFRYKAGCEKLNVVGELKAGAFPTEELKAGQAFRIFTGAPMPKGADTVIPQELVKKEDDAVVFEKNAVKRGANVRKQGTQTRKGEVILKRGRVLDPGALSLAASVGVDKLKVFRRPYVGIIVTGDELVTPGKKLKPGQIYDSNTVLLTSALNTLNVVPRFVFRVADSRKELDKHIDTCLEHCDVVLLTGGISVGDYDFVYELLNSRGVKKLFYKLKQRPGKPLFAGVRDETMVFALPGNPVSVASCFVQYVKPVIRHLRGFDHTFEPDLKLPLSSDFQKQPGLTYFLKVRTTPNAAVVPKGQQSFNLMPFTNADAFAELDAESEVVRTGTMVNVYKW